MDKARKLTDKKLNSMESEISRVYRKNPAISQIEKKYKAFMDSVQAQTQDLYEAFVKETDPEKRSALKKEYVAEVKHLTLESAEYKRLLKDVTKTLASVNQQALDVSNKAMREIYAINYNQVAEECRRVGIKVDGRKEEEEN